MTVWKFVLDLERGPVFTIAVPVGAQVVHVGRQGHAVCLWATCDELAARELRRFEVVGTGYEVPQHGTHVGTALTHDGAYVWHVFEVAA